MPDFKKNFRPGGSSRPFNKGGSGRDFGQKELYDAECNSCHNRCQVPFRPNGKKPVYCSNCFKRDERPEGNFERRPFEQRSFDRPQRANTPPPAPDRRIDDLKRQLDSMQAAIEKLTATIETSNRSKALGQEVRKHVPAAKPASPPKKAAAPAKAPAKKAPAAPRKIAKKASKKA